MNSRLLPPLLLALSAFFVFVLLFPKYERIKLVNEATKVQEKELQDRQKIFASIKILKDQINNKTNDIRKLNELIPDKKSVPELISSLTEISGQAGLAVNDLNFGDVLIQAESVFREIQIDLKMSGNYIATRNFLRLLEKNTRLINATSIKISQTPGSGLLAISVQLRAYYVPVSVNK